MQEDRLHTQRNPAIAAASWVRASALACSLPGCCWEALEDLEAQELRLYVGWGDHLPVEVQERIELLHRRRLELEAQLDIM